MSLSAGKSYRVTVEQLREMQSTPQPTSSWHPIAHIELIDTLTLELNARGLQVVRTDIAVSPSEHKLFGTMDLDDQLSPGIASALGFRTANDKSMRHKFVAGGRVFVCDNMMLSGEAVIASHKHTWGFNLRSSIQRGLDLWQRNRVNMASSIEKMQNTPINDITAQALLAKSLFDGVTTHAIFKDAYEFYFVKAVTNPELYPDCAPRTAWGLHNAYTRALKDATPNAAFSTNVALGRVFGL